MHSAGAWMLDAYNLAMLSVHMQGHAESTQGHPNYYSKHHWNEPLE